MIKQLPNLDASSGINSSPHAVILGAGASVACCLNGDANGLKLPVMNDLVSTLSLKKEIEACGLNPRDNFELLYSKIHEMGREETLLKIDQSVRNFFGALQLPDEVTIYDKLILGLRRKDILVSFNWDPLLAQAYRRWRHLGNHLPQLVFLHGNVDVMVDDQNRASKFAFDITEADAGFVPSKLLYPVEEKDYVSDAFIKSQWDLAEDLLNRSYLVTIIGYSAPKTDVKAKELLLNAWSNNPTRTLAEFSIIDIADRDIIEGAWADFRADTHSSIFDNFATDLVCKYPRRSCDAFAHATLQQNPWTEDPFPDSISLAEIESWVAPLIEEEESGKFSGVPHHR